MPPRHTLIELPTRTDARGALTFGQQGDHIPFPVKRLFVLHDIAEGAGRGAHAHRQQHQLLIMLVGSAVVTVDDGTSRTAVTLDRPGLALHAPPMLWLELNSFSAGAVCLVLTSDVYSESDYVRDRSEFQRVAQ